MPRPPRVGTTTVQKKTLIIGICGRKGAGKSTLARIISEHYGFEMKTVLTLPFAYRLKAGLTAFGFDQRLFTDPNLKELPVELMGGKSPRYLMVTLATEWARNMIDPDFWVKLWARDARENAPHFDVILVDDVRFPNEIKAVREAGGLVIGIKKPGEVAPPPRWKFWKKRPHASESLRYEDFGIPILMNDGTVEELGEKFRGFLRQSS